MLTHSSGGQLFKSFLAKLHGRADWLVRWHGDSQSAFFGVP